MIARCQYYCGFSGPLEELSVVQLSHAPRSKNPQWQEPIIICDRCRADMGRSARKVKGAKIVVLGTETRIEVLLP